ncbi:hypothetical protein ACTFIT_006992 [Dictyostelium discoideum]
MTGIHKLRPSSAKYKEIWDANQVFKHLSTIKVIPKYTYTALLNKTLVLCKMFGLARSSDLVKWSFKVQISLYPFRNGFSAVVKKMGRWKSNDTVDTFYDKRIIGEKSGGFLNTPNVKKSVNSSGNNTTGNSNNSKSSSGSNGRSNNFNGSPSNVATIPSLPTVPTTVFRRTRSKLTSRWTSVPPQTSLERIGSSKLLSRGRKWIKSPSASKLQARC